MRNIAFVVAAVFFFAVRLKSLFERKPQHAELQAAQHQGQPNTGAHQQHQHGRPPHPAAERIEKVFQSVHASSQIVNNIIRTRCISA